MLIALIILILIIVITGYITGNFLFNLALNPKSSKSIIFNSEIDEIKAQMKIENTKWLNENTKEVDIQNKKLKLHGYIAKNEKESKTWVIAVHGYTDSAYFMVDAVKQFLHYGYNVLIPDLRAHGKSEGKYIGMGWLDRLDIAKWVDYINDNYPNKKIILYGVSMGAATVMMSAGENLKNVVCAIEDCGYVSVEEEMGYQLKKIFKLPKFPVIYISSIICKLKSGYYFKEASCITQLNKSKIPILFIHGDRDTFVPTFMVYELYNQYKAKKDILVINNATHAKAMYQDGIKYWDKIFKFLDSNIS